MTNRNSNFCSVKGCVSKQKDSELSFFTLPKDFERRNEWLKVIGRPDLSNKVDLKQDSYKVCSIHFEQTVMSEVRIRKLLTDAIPSLLLPNQSRSQSKDDQSTEQPLHHNIICNSCNSKIVGFRYKCVTCPDYDLCPKCEMLEVHPDHYVIRIPKPIKFKVADDLTDKWRQFFKANHVLPESKIGQESDSSDDEPITKYVKNYDSGIDLSEDTKSKIRDEVSRVLKITKDLNSPNVQRKLLKKRHGHDLERPYKKQKSIKTDDVEEVAFADVNEINTIDGIKLELPVTFEKPTKDCQPSAPGNNDLDQKIPQFVFS